MGPTSQWPGSGLGQNGSTSKRGTEPAWSSAAMSSMALAALPTITVNATRPIPKVSLRFSMSISQVGMAGPRAARTTAYGPVADPAITYVRVGKWLDGVDPCAAAAVELPPHVRHK